MKICLVGQSVLHDPILERYPQRLGPLSEIISRSDVAFTNLETTIRARHGGWPMISSSLTPPTRRIFSPPEVLDELKRMGFNTLSLCNNHAFILGPNGILSTLEEVGKRGFLSAGIGATLKDAATPGRQSIKGKQIALVAMDGGPNSPTVYAADEQPPYFPSRPGNNPMRVAPLVEVDEAKFAMIEEIRKSLKSFDIRPEYIKTPAPETDSVTLSSVIYPGAPNLKFRKGKETRAAFDVNKDDLARNLAAVKSEKAAGSFVIVYLHHHLWEPVWEHTPAWMQAVCRQFVEAGADIVVSHGVPVLHGVEIYRGKPIFYSLGNFIFQPFSEANVWLNDRIWLSVVATCEYDGDRLKRIDFVPLAACSQDALRQGSFDERDAPEIATGVYAEKILGWLKSLSATFGTTVAVDGERASIDL